MYGDKAATMRNPEPIKPPKDLPVEVVKVTYDEDCELITKPVKNPRRDAKRAQIHVRTADQKVVDAEAATEAKTRGDLFIDGIVSLCRKTAEHTVRDALSLRLDRFLLNRYLALPIFMLILFGIFSLTFGGPVSSLSDLLEKLFLRLQGALRGLLVSLSAPHLLVSLLCDGIIPGIGAVLVFLPQIAVLFLLMSLLEDSGYMSRAAFIMDRIFSAFGLTGTPIRIELRTGRNPFAGRRNELTRRQVSRRRRLRR
jgi:ferrous iron transport protein B